MLTSFTAKNLAVVSHLHNIALICDLPALATALRTQFWPSACLETKVLALAGSIWLQNQTTGLI